MCYSVVNQMLVREDKEPFLPLSIFSTEFVQWSLVNLDLFVEFDLVRLFGPEFETRLIIVKE